MKTCHLNVKTRDMFFLPVALVVGVFCLLPQPQLNVCVPNLPNLPTHFLTTLYPFSYIGPVHCLISFFFPPFRLSVLLSLCPPTPGSFVSSYYITTAKNLFSLFGKFDRLSSNFLGPCLPSFTLTHSISFNPAAPTPSFLPSWVLCRRCLDPCLTHPCHASVWTLPHPLPGPFPHPYVASSHILPPLLSGPWTLCLPLPSF